MKYLIPVLIFLGALSACKEPKKAEEKPTAFSLTDKMLASTTTIAVASQPLTNELNFYGKIAVDNNKLVEVYPIVGGNVVKVNIELGDYVQKGQVLAVIRSTEVAGFDKELDDAKSDVLVARNNLKTSEELVAGKLAAEREVVEANNQLTKALSQQRRVEQTYDIYNIKQGGMYEVHAPINGFIIEKKINQGMMLRSDKTDNIFDIAEINDVWAMANVNEGDINNVKLGMDARVSTLSYPDKEFRGKVDKIFNIIDPETKAMKVGIRLSNSNYLLKPEMGANIKISYTEGKQMLAIPSNTVIFDKSKNFVMIFKSRNDIETRQVEVFRQVGTTTFIISGLQAGEKVITQNQLLVYDALND